MEFLIAYGCIGVFIASFLAATVLPFSSEVVLTGVLLAGSSYWACMIAATLGNFLGGMSCYWLGAELDKRERFMDWILCFSAGNRRLYCRGFGLSSSQRMDCGCFDVFRQSYPLLGMDGIYI